MIHVNQPDNWHIRLIVVRHLNSLLKIWNSGYHSYPHLGIDLFVVSSAGRLNRIHQIYSIKFNNSDIILNVTINSAFTTTGNAPWKNYCPFTEDDVRQVVKECDVHGELHPRNATLTADIYCQQLTDTLRPHFKKSERGSAQHDNARSHAANKTKADTQLGGNSICNDKFSHLLNSLLMGSRNVSKNKMSYTTNNTVYSASVCTFFRLWRKLSLPDRVNVYNFKFH